VERAAKVCCQWMLKNVSDPKGVDTKLSRTSKRRLASDDSSVAADLCRKSTSDTNLLGEIRNLSAQLLEPRYRTKLAAIGLLLEGREHQLIEQRAKVSLRTVQRWASEARRFGVGALRGHLRGDRSSTLSAEQRARLADELKKPPTHPGQRFWTAALLMRHLRENYAATVSLRHSRRLLNIFEARRPAPIGMARPPGGVARTPPEHQARTNRPETSAPRQLGDYASKRRGLAGIKRLASSGMPLQPFAYTLFDLVRDAVPYDEKSPGLAICSGEGSRWIVRDFDFERWYPHMQKYLLDAGPEVSGFNPSSLLPLNPRTVLVHDQIVRPHYYRSEGYNEFFRSMGMHHALLTLLRDSAGCFLGYYPMFRSERMEPFVADDIAFFEAAAAHIALGVSTAALVGFQSTNDDAFEPFLQAPVGVVVMDYAGRVLSVNRMAQSVFRQFAVYDGWTTATAHDDAPSAPFSYIACQLRAIFGSREEINLDAEQPVARIYSHGSGAMLRLRGFISDLGDSRGHFTVLIELGETESLLRQRLLSRYRLSQRQADLLMFLRQGVGNRDIARRLSIRPPALKSSLRELRFKLDLPGRSSLREFARSIAARSTVKPKTP
jgi:transposase/DNA-binding CsgD family transcriptional regulator